MALLEINKNPSKRQLRQFAGIWFPAVILLLGIFLLRRTGSLSLTIVIWAVGLVVSLVGLVIPPLIRRVYLGWILACYPIGWTLSHLLLAIVFVLLLTPIGMVLRWLGRDPLNRSLDRSAKTYWTPHIPDVNIQRYFKQF